MKINMSSLAAVAMLGLGTLTTGCYAETGYVVANDAYAYDCGCATQTVAAAGPDVYVVNGQPSVYYADQAYWTYSGNTWYRSSYSTGGWVAVNTAPVVVMNYRSSYGSSYGYSQPTRHVPARPHIARHPARPSVHVGQSNPGPSFRSGGSVHVGASPSVRSGGTFHTSASPSVRSGGTFHTSASPSFRSGGSVHMSHGRIHGR